MLGSNLWSGLRDPQLKNANRFKYDEKESDFYKLRIQIRKIEKDLPPCNTKTAPIQQQSVARSSDGKIKGIEKSIDRKIESKFLEKYDKYTSDKSE